MSNSNNMTNEEVRRLSWRCRRGLLELDIVLQRFTENHLTGLSNQELAAFNSLLDFPDNDFLDIVMYRKEFVKVDASEIEKFHADDMAQMLKKLRISLNE